MKRTGLSIALIGMAAFVGLAALTGCQLTENGQTLPSAYYLEDDIQFHPAGTEFQYQKEVDQIKKEQAERDLARQGNYNL
ncbi:MAG: hypothetical protein PHQ75_00150 [Thermoguttaceae bacterium]|nr:hypothetical protein [Thermoguttaceae bacterium]